MTYYWGGGLLRFIDIFLFWSKSTSMTDTLHEDLHAFLRAEVTALGFPTLGIRQVEIGSACSTRGELRNVYTILVRKPAYKRPHGRPRRRWEDNIKVHLKEIEFQGVY
jgi:hypothetical protein